MRDASFSLHLAVGTKGEFGYNGKLPWGSYPDELKLFWDSLEIVKQEGRVIVVGNNTWNGLPAAVKRRLDTMFGGNLQVINGENTLTHLLMSLPEGVHYACIGGAYLLETVMLTEKVDSVYMSYIESEDGFIPSDTDLDMDLLMDVITELDLITASDIEPHNGYMGTHYSYRRPE